MRRIAAAFILASLVLAAPSASATYAGRNGEFVAVIGGGKAGTVSSFVVRVNASGRRIEARLICTYAGAGCVGVSDAALAPDGRQLVAVSGEYRGTGTPILPDLRLIELAGGMRRIPLPTVPQEGLPWTLYGGVTWAPDGKHWLVQRSISDGGGRTIRLGLNLIGLDGADQGRLIDGDASQPDWSSKWDLAFIRGDAQAGQGALWVRRADGTLKQLTSPGAARPSWSPDGRKIAFTHGCHHDERDPQCGIYAIPAVGGPPRLTARRGGTPVWSPDGKHIAFLRIENDLIGSQHLYVANAKTRRVRRVTTEVLNPAWDSVIALEWRAIQRRRTSRHISPTS